MSETNTGAMTVHEPQQQAIGQHTVAQHGMTRDKIELLKRTVAKDATDDEFALFMTHCQRTGLDPFLRQVHAVKRYDSEKQSYVMSIQTGIDGFRLIAERTGKYAPGRDVEYAYDKEHRLISARAFVKKYTAIDGTWHEVSASAFYDEYVQLKRDGNPNRMWQRMPHVMLAKVAEALALRKAFPADFSGVYIAEEMMQQESEGAPDRSRAPKRDDARREKDQGDVDPSERDDERPARRAGCIYVEDAKILKTSDPKSSKKWKLYGIVLGMDGHTRSLTTFDDTIFETAQAAMRDNTPVEYAKQKTDRMYDGKPQYEIVKLERVFYGQESDDDAQQGDESPQETAQAEGKDGEIVNAEVIDDDAEATLNDDDGDDSAEDSTPIPADDVKAKADEMIQQMKGKGKGLKGKKSEPSDDEKF